MNIKEINFELTKSEQEVAFDLSEAPDPKAFKRTVLGLSRVDLMGSTIIFKVTHPGVKIGSKHTDEFLDAYHGAVAAVAEEAENAKAKHRHMLEEISKRTGIPVGQDPKA